MVPLRYLGTLGLAIQRASLGVLSPCGWPFLSGTKGLEGWVCLCWTSLLMFPSLVSFHVLEHPAQLLWGQMKGCKEEEIEERWSFGAWHIQTKILFCHLLTIWLLIKHGTPWRLSLLTCKMEMISHRMTQDEEGKKTQGWKQAQCRNSADARAFLCGRENAGSGDPVTKHCPTLLCPQRVGVNSKRHTFHKH